LKEASAKYGPCSICRPPVLSATKAPAGAPTSTTPAVAVPVERATTPALSRAPTSGRCQAITKKGHSAREVRGREVRTAGNTGAKIGSSGNAQWSRRISRSWLSHDGTLPSAHVEIIHPTGTRRTRCWSGCWPLSGVTRQGTRCSPDKPGGPRTGCLRRAFPCRGGYASWCADGDGETVARSAAAGIRIPDGGGLSFALA
jgi:hypothetical protein